MPRITKVSPQKRKKRVNIFIDEKFAFGASLEILAKYNLQVGQKLSQEEIEKIIKEGEFQKVYDKALRFLSYRPRSEKEIKDYFYKKGVGEETQKLVLKKLKKTGLLDDKEFALWWIEQRMTFRPSGKRLLEQELRKKGINREIIEEILEEIFKKERETQGAIAGRLYPSFELKLALKVAKKKLPTYRKLPFLEFRQKMTSFLARRGFSWEVIKEVIDKLRSDNLKNK